MFDWQAGTAQITLRNGFDRQTIDSIAVRRAIVTSADLTRENINSAFNLELPLVDRGVGALGGNQVLADQACAAVQPFPEQHDQETHVLLAAAADAAIAAVQRRVGSTEAVD